MKPEKIKRFEEKKTAKYKNETIVVKTLFDSREYFLQYASLSGKPPTVKYPFSLCFSVHKHLT